MGRLSPLAASKLDPEQRKLFEAITTGKRSIERRLSEFMLEDGSLRGPFNAWLHAPKLGQPAQRLGEAIRYESRLPSKLRELAILSVAARWRADYEWWAHSRIARAVGLDDEMVAALKTGALSKTANAAEQAVHRFALELMERKRVTETTYRQALAVLGDAGLVELVTLLGYYVLVSMVLNAFEVQVPEGETTPFAPKL